MNMNLTFKSNERLYDEMTSLTTKFTNTVCVNKMGKKATADTIITSKVRVNALNVDERRKQEESSKKHHMRIVIKTESINQNASGS